MRKELIKYFKEGIIACDGSEKERYTKIYDELKSGYHYVTDEYE